MAFRDSEFPEFGFTKCISGETDTKSSVVVILEFYRLVLAVAVLPLRQVGMASPIIAKAKYKM